MGGLRWKNDHEFSLHGMTYACIAEGLGAFDSADMQIYKPRWLIEKYAALFDELQPRRLFEIGIFGGGSTALFAQLANPEKHVAIDVRPNPIPPLARFIDEHDLTGTVVPYFGVDQGDGDRLAQICDDEFDAPLDLVIDDASHLLGPTTSTFNALFPRLRPGGAYVIEDWSWAQVFAVTDIPLPGHFVGQRPLSNLVAELVLASATSPDAVTEVRSARSFAVVRRGPTTLDRDTFTVSSLQSAHLSSGRRLPHGWSYPLEAPEAATLFAAAGHITWFGLPSYGPTGAQLPVVVVSWEPKSWYRQPVVTLRPVPSADCHAVHAWITDTVAAEISAWLADANAAPSTWKDLKHREIWHWEPQPA
jgi:cephalosporin hydroxylase